MDIHIYIYMMLVVFDEEMCGFDLFRCGVVRFRLVSIDRVEICLVSVRKYCCGKIRDPNNCIMNCLTTDAMRVIA